MNDVYGGIYGEVYGEVYGFVFDVVSPSGNYYLLATIDGVFAFRTAEEE